MKHDVVGKVMANDDLSRVLKDNDTLEIENAKPKTLVDDLDLFDAVHKNCDELIKGTPHNPILAQNKFNHFAALIRNGESFPDKKDDDIIDVDMPINPTGTE